MGAILAHNRPQTQTYVSIERVFCVFQLPLERILHGFDKCEQVVETMGSTGRGGVEEIQDQADIFFI